jgi:photosystem II stability/assembly factor-like uncharacterized protein
MRKEFQAEKQRHEVAVQRFALPLRDAAPRSLEAFWNNRHTYRRAANAEWIDGGPSNYAGRATCLAIHPKNSKVLYAGSAAGGLWKSENEGATWTSCWPNGLNQNIGAVAIDPQDSRIVCATGEGNLSTASYPGSGIYVSDDGGDSWRSFIFIPMRRRLTAEDRNSMPRRVSSISFSARDGAGFHQVAFGSISNDEQMLGGLYLSDTNQLNFVQKWSTRPYNCYSVVFHPTEPRTIFAAIEAGGAVNGIWRSTDGGRDWKQLKGGLPAGELCGRISLAISSKDPRVMWALISTRRRKVLGVFCSLTGGRTWENMAGSAFEHEKQLAFNNTIAIHPEEPRIVVCGAQHLFLTEDSGRKWRQISEDQPARSPSRRNSRYVHPDHHAIVLPGGSVIYSANDGGIARSPDLGKTWESYSEGMNTVMFYAIDVSPVNPDLYGGGAQDSGTLLAGVNAGVNSPVAPRRGGKRAAEFTRVLIGDGGYVVFDSKEEELVFASTFSTETRCHEPGRRWTQGLRVTKWRNASPAVAKAERDVLGLTVMAVRPPARGRRRELWLGTNRLWRSRNDGRSWRPSLFQFDGSAVTAIEIANADPDMMYVGTAHGGIYASRDGGIEWSSDLAGPEIPNRVITQIETHPRNASAVVVTVASTGLEGASLSGVSRPYSHVFASADGGRMWKDLDRGELPNVVFNGLAFETHPPFRIFVAGDAGPWVLNPDGRWVSIAGDMPSAVISDIIYHGKSRTLTAGTYGRGIWRMKVPRKFQVVDSDPNLDADALLPPIEGYFLDPAVPVPEPLTPAEGAVFNVFPRKTEFACSPVPGAMRYVFEAATIERFSVSRVSPVPSAELEMIGMGDYRWTCWALYPGGRCSLPSKAVGFRYLK